MMAFTLDTRVATPYFHLVYTVHHLVDRCSNEGFAECRDNFAHCVLKKWEAS